MDKKKKSWAYTLRKPEGKDYPLQYSGLENSMACIVHVVAKSWTRLSDFHYCMPGIVLSALYLFMYFFYHLFFF